MTSEDKPCIKTQKVATFTNFIGSADNFKHDFLADIS